MATTSTLPEHDFYVMVIGYKNLKMLFLSMRSHSMELFISLINGTLEYDDLVVEKYRIYTFSFFKCHNQYNTYSQAVHIAAKLYVKPPITNLHAA